MITIKPGPGAREFFAKVGNLQKATKKGIRMGLYYSGKQLVETASKGMLAKDKTGREYNIRTRGGRRLRHRASSPGQYPANLSGKLRKSLDFKVHGSDKMFFGYEDVNYGKFLELGTNKIQPRPGLEKAVKSNERNIEKNLSREIMKWALA